MIDLIDKYRKQQGITKEQICKYCNINKNTYTNYLKGAKLPIDTAKMMLQCLDKQLLIVDKIVM